MSHQSQNERSMSALVKQEPRILRGSVSADREARAQQLANLFIGEVIPLLVQVRQDFLDKDPHELICGCRTFTEYCIGILRYSESHIRRLIAGHNPAKKFDGSKNRKPELAEDTRTSVERLHDSGFVEKCMEHDPVLLGLVLAQAMCLDSPDPKALFRAARLEGEIVGHICNEADKREAKDSHTKECRCQACW
jgi:hypothetical protein